MTLRTFRVELLIFHKDPGLFREVENVEYADDTPRTEILQRIFHSGQNDIQPQDKPSVSSGDVIWFDDDTLYLIKSEGFRRLTVRAYVEYINASLQSRLLQLWSQTATDLDTIDLPPNLYAFTETKNGHEGLLALQVEGRYLPFVTSREGTLQALKGIAVQYAQETGHEIKLMTYHGGTATRIASAKKENSDGEPPTTDKA